MTIRSPDRVQCISAGLMKLVWVGKQHAGQAHNTPAMTKQVSL